MNLFVLRLSGIMLRIWVNIMDVNLCTSASRFYVFHMLFVCFDVCNDDSRCLSVFILWMVCLEGITT